MDMPAHMENHQHVGNAALEKNELEEIENIKINIKKLYSIWDLFGLQSEQKLQRAKIVWEHMHILLKDILNEETSFYEDIQERVQNYTSKIKELSQILSVSPQKISGSLIKREEILRHELDNLMKLKNQKIKIYQDLKKEEFKLCQILQLTEHQLPAISGVPSESDLREVEQHILQLKNEKERRHVKFHNMKKELTTILETTELAPEPYIEKGILFQKEDSPFSNETFIALEKAICRAQTKKAELATSKQELLNRLLVLWQRLKVEKSKRVDFLSRHSDCRLSTLKSIEHELERCEKMKKDNIRMFVDSLREELNHLWITCHASEYQKRLFKPYCASDMTDEILSAFDSEVEKWKKYYKEIEHILKKIDKRQQLFELMVEFESRTTDPNRFKNRKGHLLKEAKQRAKWEKELPALEKELFHDIEIYESEKGAPFLYYGEDYRAFVTNQWEAREAQKENERLEKQKFVNKSTMHTPAKRPLMTTPKSAPSKLFKSSTGLATPSTPVNYPKRFPNTVGKPISKGIKIGNLQQSPILKSKGRLALLNKPVSCSNRTPNAKSMSKSNKISNLQHSPILKSNRRLAIPNTLVSYSSRTPKTRKSISKINKISTLQPTSVQIKGKDLLKEINHLTPQRNDSPNTTTYSDFVEELKIPNRCSSRISVLATKKPGGTRIGLNNNPNKKNNTRSASKSPRILSAITSNLTPAKKKFGFFGN